MKTLFKKQVMRAVFALPAFESHRSRVGQVDHDVIAPSLGEKLHVSLLVADLLI